MQTELKIAYADYNAVKYACTHWHYSKSVPCGKLIKFGVWENNEFKGVVLFSRGATQQIGDPYNLKQTQVCELTRVALRNHEHPVTEIVSKCLKLLHKTNPKIELVVSYSDLNQKHLGVIYQAGNWIYEGYKKVTPSMIVNGKKVHTRTLHSRYGHNGLNWIKRNIDPNAKFADDKGRFKYLYPLTKKARRKYEHLHQPYPKDIK